MHDALADFVEQERIRLSDAIQRYLDGATSHETIRDVAWSIIERWSSLAIEGETPESPDEEALWAAVWAVQHFADDEHWRDGVTRRSLEPLQIALRDRTALPTGWSAPRPN